MSDPSANERLRFRAPDPAEKGRLDALCASTGDGTVPIPDGSEGWLISRRHGDEIIGAVALCPCASDELRITLVLSPAARGQGLAREAAAWLVEQAWRRRAGRTVTASIPLGEAAAMRVAEAVGMGRTTLHESPDGPRIRFALQPDNEGAAPRPQVIHSKRMRLVVGGPAVLAADLSGHVALASILGAQVPASWPPPQYRVGRAWMAERLSEKEALPQWFGWYALLPTEAALPRLVAAVGWLGPPDANGEVEIGAAVAQEAQGQRLGSEASLALVGWGAACTEIRQICGQTHFANGAGFALACDTGFVQTGLGRKPDHLLWTWPQQT